MATSMTRKGREKAELWKLTPSESESWGSCEWLLRQKMDSLEHLIREFRNDVRIIAGPRRKEEIDALVSALVTDLWCNVAQVGTAKVKAELGELEYVLAKNTPENKEVLLSGGFSEEEIAHANDGGEMDIDLSTLAFNYSDANCWSINDGFYRSGEETQ
jgi:hypothetical protein